MKTDEEMRAEYQREDLGDATQGKHYEAYRSGPMWRCCTPRHFRSSSE